ncbi:NhaP-type Na+/H+ and K+/H+ antiporters with a unique C-terminal domain (fragment) [Cupriavidus necator]|uniref:NhaP-type Na+/H+ and K+/H+ antiporters with a unique C-terminal domain n=2 Tax=Cupriavidus necator TaxID=106590 RepID=A0A1K0JJJ6_CUPNE
MQFEVGPNAPVENVRADQLELPPRCRLLTVARDDALAALDQTVLRAGDSVSVLAPVTTLPMLSALFQAQGRAPTWEQASHDFLLSGDALLRDVAALYGTRALTPEEEPLTLESAMQRAFTSPPVEGDSVAIAGLPLTVTRMEGAQILQVGLLLPRLDGDSGGRLWPRRRKDGAERGGEGAEAE